MTGTRRDNVGQGGRLVIVPRFRLSDDANNEEGLQEVGLIWSQNTWMKVTALR